MKALRTAGFTLIELLIVVSIIGLLAAAFLPDLLSAQTTANASADAANLRQQFQWFETYKSRVKHMPTEGGHKFVLDPWVKKVVNPTVENFDRYFTPGLREQDPVWINLRKEVQLGNPVWTDLATTSSKDTHYAGRSKEYLLGMTAANEAWAATDNEFGWNLQDGTINYLVSGGAVRSLSLQQLMDLYQWPGLEQVFPTYGPESPIEALQKLDR